MSENPRYGTNSNNTSEWMNALKNEYNKMPRGAFNDTRRKSFDVPLYGIVPVECWEMVPNSEAYLQYDISAIAKNPTVKKLLSGMNIELRVYKINYNDCFEGWNNFITKGRSGKVTKSLPYLAFSPATGYTTSLPYNPCHYLNLAPSVFLAQDLNGDKFKFPTNTGIKSVSGDNLQSSLLTGINSLTDLAGSVAMRVSALPFVFYNKIAKNYQTANLLQDNTNWYPENENHDNILPYSATGGVTTSSYDYPTQVFNPNNPVQPDNTTDTYPWLNVLWYSQRKGDMFNTGSPFPDLLRGDIPTLDVLTAHLNANQVVATSSTTGSSSYILGMANNLLGLLDSGAGANSGLNKSGTSNPTSWYSATSTPPSTVGIRDTSDGDLRKLLNKITIDGINYSLSQWRYLATLTVMRERLALTDGSYNEMIEAMFGHNPRWHNHEAIYVGGHSQPIVFSEVINQTESVNAPLGSMAGRAYSDTASQTIHVTSDDFGMFMTVMVVTPDEYYSQGVDKMFSRLENAEQYFPILNNLSADATLNRELYVSGNNNTDMDVFNYQERFAYYKSRRNQVSGLLSLPASLIGDDGVYIQNRLFGSTPQFNQAFSRGELTTNEKAIFSATDLAPFVVTVGCGMRYVGPIPENARPSDMGISY